MKDDYSHFQTQLHMLVKHMDAAFLRKDYIAAALYAAHVQLLANVLKRIAKGEQCS